VGTGSITKPIIARTVKTIFVIIVVHVGCLGVITLESSLGGFHVLSLNGETWILERGTYWASEGSVDVGYHREEIHTALRAGEGPIYLQNP
jgi:uncharacterized protein (AIM24 family)